VICHILLAGIPVFTGTAGARFTEAGWSAEAAGGVRVVDNGGAIVRDNRRSFDNELNAMRGSPPHTPARHTGLTHNELIAESPRPTTRTTGGSAPGSATAAFYDNTDDLDYEEGYAEALARTMDDGSSDGEVDGRLSTAEFEDLQSSGL
jgi:hypothetical protein